jgi:serine protease Do
MSLFDDDFYSTKVKRSTRREERPGFGGGRGFRSMSTFRVAVVSSLVSALAVVLLFVLITGTPDSSSNARPAMAGGQSLVETSERIITASEKIRPAVVSIINITQQAQDPQPSGSADPNTGDLPANASLGSGVIFEKKGGKAYIITNSHVVADAAEVQAVLVNGEKKMAKIVGQDTISDLAVLSVDADGIDVVAEIGSSDKLRVGEMVIAVGNPLGFGDSVTQGIVSFLHRVVPVSLNQDGIYDWEQEVVQTTAAINQGNSGGVLADLNGSVVGINSMKIADTGVEGIGFAIPIDTVMPIIDQIMKDGKVLRPYMGVISMDLSTFLDNPDTTGDGTVDPGTDNGGDVPQLVVPEGVKDGALVLDAMGPAGDAGLQLNDIITELDGKPIKGTMDLRKYLYNEKKIGESLTVTYYRDGKKAEAKVTLTEKDKDQ